MMIEHVFHLNRSNAWQRERREIVLFVLCVVTRLSVVCRIVLSHATCGL
jgi:hypothetical protein